MGRSKRDRAYNVGEETMKNCQRVSRELMVVERSACWNPRVRRILKAAPLVVMFLLLNTRAAPAACTFNPTPDPTVDGSANSLRHAIQMANTSGQDCLIQLQTGTYTLTIKNTNGQENNAAEGDLDITASGHTVTVQGKGQTVSFVNGNGIDRVFQVLGGANAVFSDLTIEGGVAQDDGTTGARPGFTLAEGGGVLVDGGGNVTFSGVSLQGNRAIGSGVSRECTAGTSASLCQTSAAGGGLFLAAGSVTLNASQVVANTAHGGAPDPCFAGPGATAGMGEGGGLFVAAGDLSLSQTTVSGNSALGSTGLIDPGDVCVFGTTGGNAAGGGLFSAGGIYITNSTVFANVAEAGKGGGQVYSTGFLSPGSTGDAVGGGLYLSSGSISLTGDTLASNQALANFGHKPGSSSGGGVFNDGASLASNTTLIGNNIQDSGNANNGDDVSGPITVLYSLLRQKDGATITDEGHNIFDENPELVPSGLQFNGGPTKTVALEEGSPADGTGDNAICKAAPPTGLGGVDQRGVARFRPGDEFCDIGAFQFVDLYVRPVSLSFGKAPVGGLGAQELRMTNNQLTSVTLSNSIGGTDPKDFIITSTTCGASLDSQATCTVTVTFRPKATGARSAVLTVSDSPDRTSPYQIPLAGTGT
jgi:hypothetical protein